MKDNLNTGVTMTQPSIQDPWNSIVHYYNWGFFGAFLLMLIFVLVVMQGIKTHFSEIDDRIDPRNPTETIKVITCLLTKIQLKNIALIVTVICVILIGMIFKYEWISLMTFIEVIVSVSLITYIYDYAGDKLLRVFLTSLFETLPFIKVPPDFLKAYSPEEYAALGKTQELPKVSPN